MDTIKITSIIISIITPSCLAIYFLYKQYLNKRDWYRRKLQGKWTNEGDILAKETCYIDVEINIDKDDGEITGIIDSMNIATGVFLPN